MINLTGLATGLAAIATAIAAGFTAYMAKQTKKSAKAAEDSVLQTAQELKTLKTQTELLAQQTSAITVQARLAQLALTRGDRPLLIPVAWEEQATLASAKPGTSSSIVTLRAFDGLTMEWQAHVRGSWVLPMPSGNLDVWVIIEMRNVGTGLAIVGNPAGGLSPGSLGGQFSSRIISDRPSTPASRALWPQQAVMPPGESTRVVARIDDPTKQLMQDLASSPQTSARITVQTEFHYQDLSQSYTYSVFVEFVYSEPQLIPGTPSFTGYEVTDIQTNVEDSRK